MTRLLHDVLHEHADGLPAPHVDLDTVVRAGDRRVRRGRVVAGLAAAAAVTLVAGAAFVVPRALDTSEPQPVTPPKPFVGHDVTYALGDTLVWGDETFPAADQVASYVVTDDALVYTTRDKTVFSFDGADTQRIGHSENGELKADDTGSLVAWVDQPQGTSPEYVVDDTGAARELARVDSGAGRASVHQIDGPDAAFVYAVDDGSVYWRTPPGVTRYDVATGTTELLSTVRQGNADEVAHPEGIDDVAGGLIAYPVGSDIDGNRVMVGTSIGDAASKLADGFLADLSPDAGHAAVLISDQLHLYTRAGEEVQVGLNEGDYHVQFAWLDDDTIELLEVPGNTKEPSPLATLLECDLGRGSCRDVRSFDFSGASPESFVPPTGEPVSQPGDF